MRRFTGLLLVVLLAVPLSIGVAIPAAYAGSTGTNGLRLHRSPFQQLVGPLFHPRHAYAGYRERAVIYERPVYVERPVYNTYPSQVVVVQPAAGLSTVVQYPHGRYELRGDGVRRLSVGVDPERAAPRASGPRRRRHRSRPSRVRRRPGRPRETRRINGDRFTLCLPLPPGCILHAPFGQRWLLSGA